MAPRRYSVLLPTRNGGPFLDGCLRSVLELDRHDFEVVVADNANTDETVAVLGAYDTDPRLRVIRSERLLTVTENWRVALDASRGEYLLMIGDDDLVLPELFERLDDIIDRYDRPDCVTFNGYRYVAPDSIRGDASSYYAAPYFNYEPGLPSDGLLSDSVRRALVQRLYSFDFAFPLTMQLTLIRRSAAARLPHGLFKSVFPDHYGVCGLLLTAERWALVDEPLVVVGVSPKSFGHFFFNDGDSGGLDYLGAPVEFAGRLPGSPVLNAICAWLEEARADFGAHLPGLDIDRGAYVARQVRYWLREYQSGRLAAPALARRAAGLAPRDVLAVVRTYGRPAGLRAVGHAALSQRTRRAEHFVAGLTPLPEIANIQEFAAWLAGARGDGAAAGGWGALAR